MIWKPKECGGLGILNLQVQSDALLLKFLHKFNNHWDLPWVELIWNTYYTTKIPHATDPCGSFWWRDVSKLMPVYRGISNVIVRNGSSALFWKDVWIGDVLAETHPRAFSFTLQEDISVRDFLCNTSLSETFHLPLSTQALEETRDLQQKTMHVEFLNPLTNDEWTCVWGTDYYSANRFYTFYFKDIHEH